MKHDLPAAVLATLLVLAGCRDAREDAQTELTRLHHAMTQHAMHYGRYPETVDAGRRTDAGNLAFKAEHGVEVRLLQSARESYQAVGTSRSWVCWMMMGPPDRGRMECAPVGSATRAASTAAGLPVDPMPGVLHSPPVARADSDSAATTR